MMRILVCLFIFTKFSSAYFSGQQVCSDLPPGTKVEDYLNCSRFYSCLFERAFLHHCPRGTWFDRQLQRCRFIGTFSHEMRTKCRNVGRVTKTPKNPREISSYKSTQQVNVSWIFDEYLRPNNRGLPGKIIMEVPIGSNGQARLELVKRENVTEHIKVVTNLRGKPEEWQPEQSEEWGIYSDPKAQASMSVVMKLVNASETVQYDGIFISDGSQYQLRADLGGIKSYPVEDKSARHVLINGTKHLLSRDIGNVNLVDHLGIKASNGTPMMSKLERLISQEQQKNSQKKNYGIELLIVIDYSVYYKWYVQSKANDEKSKTADVISKIKYFYTHIVSGVNDRYMNIVDNDFGFYVKVVGYSIAQVPEDSQFTEKSGIKIQGQYAIWAYEALDEFERWVEARASQPESKLPAFDSAALFTDYEMKYGERTITGLANIGAVCTSTSISVNKDHGQYATIGTAAHEIGHNLGSLHDGEKNDCKSEEQYVMAQSPGGLSNSTFYNPFHFSTCSIDYFRTQIRKLDKENNNCLLNAASNNDPSFDENLKTLPGKLYDADLQCQLLFGNSSFYCAGGGERDALICKELSCWNPKASQCSSKVEQRALEGTKCGNGAWCIRGSCTPDPKAPKTPATCIYGDLRAPFILDDKSVNCSWMAKNRPDRCYYQHYRDLCCSSCAAQADGKNPGCEWGDKSIGQDCLNLKSGDCYEAFWKDHCCATCKRFEVVNPPTANCKYGDRMDCKSIKSGNCYNAEQFCCQTCASFKINITGCEYGDVAPNCGPDHCREKIYWGQCCYTCRDSIKGKASKTLESLEFPSCHRADLAHWCSRVTGPDCYEANKTCCNSCEQFYDKDRIGCEYGDKASWCSSKVQNAVDCQNKEVASICCHSCRTHSEAKFFVAPKCFSGDQSDFCRTMKPWECYNFKDTCCETCSRHYNSSIQNCEYGNKVNWCESYVRDLKDCSDSEVATSCCKTCHEMSLKTDFRHREFSPRFKECNDDIEWCSGMFTGFCYDPKVRSNCCSTCETIMKKNAKNCPYGDRYNWCSKEYCSMNAEECCETCWTMMKEE